MTDAEFTIRFCPEFVAENLQSLPRRHPSIRPLWQSGLSQNPKLDYNPPPDGAGHVSPAIKEAIMMPREEIRQILQELFEIETGDPISSLQDDQSLSEQLGLDSVDMVSLIMQLERRFKIRLAHDELANAHQVGLLLDLVQRKLAGGLKVAA